MRRAGQSFGDRPGIRSTTAVTNEITRQHLLDFFTLKGHNPVAAPLPSATRGEGLIKEVTKIDEVKERRKRDENYAKQYQEEEEKELTQQFQSKRTTIELSSGDNMPASQMSTMFSQVEEPSLIGEASGLDGLSQEDNREFYDRYRSSFDENYDTGLPITPFRETILKYVAAEPVVIIQGCTGSGKTTQVPQYILDGCAKQNVHSNIVVTQPRRIAAISVANRVAQERGVQIGTLVGYQIGMDNKTSQDTRITYMTTGILLQKLIGAKHMNNFTHIIIDEIHERDQDTDFLMMVVRKFLRSNSRSVKVILMSATIDTSIFGKYFSMPFRGQLRPAAELTIPGKTRTVLEFYLESLQPLGPLPNLDPYAPSVASENYEIVYKLICTFDRIEVNEYGESEIKGLAITRGTVLVFLPGYEQIKEMQKMLQDSQAGSAKRWWILPLHSSITRDEQKRVFQNPQPTYRKIILSTNIAESSITVPDIRYVIDFCLTKNLVCDPNTNYCCLQLEWAAKANCNQRKGRAGRVADGRVYRLVTSQFFEKFLLDYGIPEMRRCPLELVVLNAKKLDLGEPKAILALTMDPPDLADIEKAILTLKELGGLKLTTNGAYTPYDGDMTFVGHVMSLLPMDVKISKLILLGHVFGCLEECIIIAASLSIVSFFAKPFKQELQAYKSRLSWAEGTFSDCLAHLYAYNLWKQYTETNFFNRPGGQSERDWAATNFIQLNRLKETSALIDEIKHRLSPLRIIPRRPPPGRRPREKEDNALILLVAICGAFYPNYFVQEETDEKLVYREMFGRNPLNTVIVKGLRHNHGILYERSIIKIFETCGQHIKISFEDTKAFVQFGIPGEKIGIDPAVYMAIKMRLLRLPLELHVFSVEEAEKKIAKIEAIKEEYCSKQKIFRSNRISLIPPRFSLAKYPAPRLGQLTIRILIIEVLDAGHFWAQNIEEEQLQLSYLSQAINMYEGENLKHVSKQIELGMLLLAPFPEDKERPYRRAFVFSIGQKTVEVFFVDYGNMRTVEKTALREITNDLDDEILKTPAQAIECVLSEVRPKIAPNCAPNEWSSKATRWFRSVTLGNHLIARIYSAVDGVLHLEVNLPMADGQEVCLNKKLIELQYAEKAEEDYNSKQNHDLRIKCEELNDDFVQKINEVHTQNSAAGDYLYVKPADLAGEASRPTAKIRLQGPSNPLEVSYVGITQMSACRKLNIDLDSVNSVTLDAEPQNHHNRLLVASYVSLNSSGNKIRGRHTTLMPRIKGIPALMALLFSPTAEFRTDRLRTRYTGALCGLGYDKETGNSYYPDHDSEVNFDVEFTHVDAVEVNSVRLCINYILGSPESFANSQAETGQNLQSKARELIHQLLSKNRNSMPFEECTTPFKWGQIPMDLHLLNKFEDLDEDMEHIFPPHECIVLLNPEEKEELKVEQWEMLQLLHSKASRSDESEFNKCPLCDVMTCTRSELLMHLNLPSHINKEEQLQQYITEASDS